MSATTSTYNCEQIAKLLKGDYNDIASTDDV